MYIYLNIDRPLFYLMDELFEFVRDRDPLSYTDFVLDELLVHSWGEGFRSCLKYSGSLKEYLDNLKIPTTIQDYILHTFKDACLSCIKSVPHYRIFNYDGYFDKDQRGIYWNYTTEYNSSYRTNCRRRFQTISNAS